VFNLSFFVIIIIIILNVVFGIILDTFGELRDERAAIEEDIRSTCFVCSLPNETFQRQALGFNHHIKFDHNMWKYLYFFVYLDIKDNDEYTFIEEYVARQKEANNNDFFPILRAICLEKSEEGGRSKKRKEEKEKE